MLAPQLPIPCHGAGPGSGGSEAAHVCTQLHLCPPALRPNTLEVSVGSTNRYQQQIIEKLGLRGTLLEQLVLQPGALRDPESYVESPSLMRFAMDVRRALNTEGWEPTPKRER